MQEERLTQEKAIWMFVKNAYDNMDTSKSLDNQIDTFLYDIHFTKSIENQFDNFLSDVKLHTDVCMIKNLFIDCFKIACQLPSEHITNTRIVLKVEKLYPSITRHHIRTILIDVFRDWLICYPKLYEAYQRMSFMFLLKVFAKHQKAEE